MPEEPKDAQPKRRRPPTLKEIADLTGVHVSTVSRVLRQDEPPDGWSEAALKVRATAESVGYLRNQWAASLRTRRTNTIGVVMPRLTDGVIATMFQGVEAAAVDAGYSVLLSSPPDELDAQRRAVDLLVSRQVDGLLLSSLHRPADQFLESLTLGTLPVLLFNRHGDSARSSVTGDDRHGGYLAATHLIEQGHRRLAIVAGPQHASTAHDRVQGFLDTAREHGIEIGPDFVVGSEFEVSGGVEAARRLLERPDRPTAVFAVNDTAAIGVLGVARDAGLRVPDDLSVVGYNDIPMVSQLPVPLTTIGSKPELIGAEALRGLLVLINGGEVESVRVPVELVLRASTSPPREDS